MTLHEALEKGLESLELGNHIDTISRYVDLLKKWNKAYNLIAKVDDQTLIYRHILDCLVTRPYMQGEKFLDIGTGAGLPGLLLAVTMPSQEWTLLDANGKKTRFCEQAVLELGLKNVTVAQQRIEHHQPEYCYDTIISRAYDQAASFINDSRRLMCQRGQILAMKGKIDAEEKAAAQATGLHMEIASLQVPGISGQRHLMKMTWPE